MTETTTKTQQMPTLQPPELAPAANVPAVVAPVARAARKVERPARVTTGDVLRENRKKRRQPMFQDHVADAMEIHADQLNEAQKLEAEAPLVAGHPELPAVAAPQPAPIVEGDTWELPAEVEKLTDEDRKKLVAYADRALSFPPETLEMSNEEHRAAVNAVFAIDPSAAVDMMIHRYVQGLQVEAAARTVAAHRNWVADMLLLGFAKRTQTLYNAELLKEGKPPLFQQHLRSDPNANPADLHAAEANKQAPLDPLILETCLEYLRSDPAAQRALSEMNTNETIAASHRVFPHIERRMKQRLASQPVNTGGQPPALSEGQFAGYRPYDAPTDARPATISATGGKTLGAIIADMRAKRRGGFQPEGN